MRCDIAKISGPLIHQDRGTSIRIDEEHELKAPFSAAYGHCVWSHGGVPSADELCLKISGIESGSLETLDHTNAEILNR
jgi:hypothetical protein